MANATPQQQAAYTQFVRNGMKLIYGNKKGLPQLLKSLDGGGDPVAGLASTVTALTLRLTDSAKKAGRPLAPEVVLYGAGELMEQLADFSEQSGGPKYDEAQLREIAQAMVSGLKQQGAAPPQAAPAQAAPATPELMPQGGGYGS